MGPGPMAERPPACHCPRGGWVRLAERDGDRRQWPASKLAAPRRLPSPWGNRSGSTRWADGGNPLWLFLVALCLLGALLPTVGSGAAPHSASEAEGPSGTQRIWLFLGQDEESGREGFLRVVNHSSQAWTVRIEAVDDAGSAAGPVDLEIGALQAIHLNSADLEGGHDVVEVELTAASLRGIDVAAVRLWNQAGPEVEALSRFVRGGGGLVVGATGWGWAHSHPTRSLVEDFVGNRLLAQAGIQWSKETRAYPTSGANYAVDGPLSRLVHAGQALDAVTAVETGTRTLTRLQKVQATDAVLRADDCLPVDDRLLAPRLAAFERRPGGFRFPSERHPVRDTDVGRRLAAALFARWHGKAPADAIDAHPAAADFPGSVPEGAARVSRRIAVDTTVPRWHSTGLYAAPGELVKVSVPPAVAADGGFMVRVGAHSDGIWSRPEWTRMPEVSRRFAVERETVPVANAFGGLVYVEVPEGVGLGMVEIEVDGAVGGDRGAGHDRHHALERSAGVGRSRRRGGDLGARGRVGRGACRVARERPHEPGALCRRSTDFQRVHARGLSDRGLPG